MLAITPLWLMLAAANTLAYAQAKSSPADWTEFHRDNMQRWNPYETVLGVGNVGNLELKWKNPIGAYMTSGGISSTVTVDGVVYFGSTDGAVYALNATTGTKLWSFTTGYLVDSSPAVANGVVYVGSWDGNLYALNASTGAKLWKYATESECTGATLCGSGLVGTSPTVANGVVYFAAFDGNVFALNASTGALLWKYTTGLHVYASPAVANGVVYVGSQDGNEYALNASTGAKLWSYATTVNNVFSSAAVAYGVVYIGASDGNVYALNASTGSLLWSHYYGDDLIDSSPAVANGVVYISGTGKFYAVKASTGDLLWNFTTGGGYESSSPAVANGVVYIGSVDGNVYALNASTGALLWSYRAGEPGLFSSPIIVDGTLYIIYANQSNTGNTYAFSVGVDADLFLRINPSTTTVHQGDLITYAFPVWNLGPDNADNEVLTTQVPEGTTFDYIRISGTPALGTCTHPPYQGTGQIVCHEGASMAPNTTWTVRLTVKLTAPAGTVITANAATMSDTPDPNMANNTATVSLTVQ